MLETIVYKKRQDGKYIAIGTTLTLQERTEIVDGEYSITLKTPKKKLLLEDSSIIKLGVNRYDPYYYIRDENYDYVKLENVSEEMYHFQDYVDSNLNSIDKLPLAFGYEGVYWDTFDNEINNSYQKIDDNKRTLLNKSQVFIYKLREHDKRMVPVGLLARENGRMIVYYFYGFKRFTDNMTVSLYSKNYYVQDTHSPRRTIDATEFYSYEAEEYKRVPIDGTWLSPNKDEHDQIEEVHDDWHYVIGYTHKGFSHKKKCIFYNQYVLDK